MLEVLRTTSGLGAEGVVEGEGVTLVTGGTVLAMAGTSPMVGGCVTSTTADGVMSLTEGGAMLVEDGVLLVEVSATLVDGTMLMEGS